MWFKTDDNNLVVQVVTHHTNPDALAGFTEIDTDQDICGMIHNPADNTFSEAPLNDFKAREKRDALLAESDWMASQDRTMSQAEKDYRQALRDVPAQAGFPTSITWPTKP